jgi:hypothetical protein
MILDIKVRQTHSFCGESIYPWCGSLTPLDTDITLDPVIDENMGNIGLILRYRVGRQKLGEYKR